MKCNKNAIETFSFLLFHNQTSHLYHTFTAYQHRGKSVQEFYAKNQLIIDSIHCIFFIFIEFVN